MLKLLLIAVLISLVACGNNNSADNLNETVENDKPVIYQDLSDEQLLDTIQYYTFQYFWEGAEPYSGMACERIHLSGVYPQSDQHVVTTGGSGFGLMALLVGIERGFISREQGLTRFEKIAGFLESADRFHGAWPHWLNGHTGKVVPFGTKDNGGDLVETAFLAQGLICVQEYFKNGMDREQQLSDRVKALWQGIEFNWYEKDGGEALYWHWSPNYGWEMNMPLKGYDECLVAYIIGASNPKHTINPEAYHKGWARSGGIVGGVSKYGYTLNVKHNGNYSAGGPLFWAHYSYLGFNPKITSDRYVNFWDINVAHTLMNRRYCIHNPKAFAGYSEDLWGLTASYSIKGYQEWENGGGRKRDDLSADDIYMGYAAHHPDLDFGIISPTAALSSMPYAPEECLKVARHIYFNLGDKAFGKYGPYDAISVEHDWFPQTYLAIDQGPIVCMIENYRSGFLWNLFMACPEVQAGLLRLDIQVAQ